MSARLMLDLFTAAFETVGMDNDWLFASIRKSRLQ